MYQECYSPLGDPCRRIYIGYFMLSKSLPMAFSIFLLSSFPTSLWVRFREFPSQIVICSQSQLREIYQYSPVFRTFSLAKRFCESIHSLSLSCLAKNKNTVRFIVEACPRLQAFCLYLKSPTPADVWRIVGSNSGQSLQNHVEWRHYILRHFHCHSASRCRQPWAGKSPLLETDVEILRGLVGGHVTV